jgi:2-polyprenyl-6-methoxyphenol hydroxylase-like FAD-dependent oxidoreductase
LKPSRTIIVGGGIGGMALAAALQRLGLPFVLLEQADALEEVGSGLGVLPGAVRALEALGVGPGLFASGAPFRRFRVATRRGEDLAELSFTRVFERAGRSGYVLHRAALHGALLAQVAPEAIRTGARAASVSQQGGEVQVDLAGGGAPVRGDLLVGADGIGSVVRRHVLGDGAPRYAGETFFRGIAEARLDEPDLCRELFGGGRRTAYYDLGGGRVYWWASAPLPAGSVIPPGQRRAFLAEAFAGWPFGVTDLHASTPEERILQNDGFDRAPARSWHRGSAVLLGDAAHPTTPNLGQGACMAIEDAVVLARAIRVAETPAEAFASFRAQRRRRTARTVRMSRLWGAVGLWRSPLLEALRDAAFRRMPEAWLERGARDQYAYDPGTLTAPPPRA